MKIIGITGNIGCGKSTVCKIFAEKYNIPIFYADLAAKDIIKNDRQVFYEIVDMFGHEVLQADHEVNRRVIFDKVFSNKEKLEEYNKILHPRVIKAFNDWKSERKNDEIEYNYIIEESALIFEAGTASGFDEIISVNCDFETRIKRATVRSGLTENDVKLIDSHQIPWLEKWQKSTLSILNHLDVANLETHVDYLHQYLIYKKDNKDSPENLI